MENANAPIVDPGLAEGMSEASAAPLPPAIPADGPADWIKKNLFSSKGNGFVTILFAIIAYTALR